MDFQKTSLFYSRRYCVGGKRQKLCPSDCSAARSLIRGPDYLTISDSQTISLLARATAGSPEVLVYLITCSIGRSIERSQLFCFSHVLAMLCTFSRYSSKWPLPQKNKNTRFHNLRAQSFKEDAHTRPAQVQLQWNRQLRPGAGLNTPAAPRL